MKIYKVSVHYEVGVVLEFVAESQEGAEKYAQLYMADVGCPEDSGRVVHRDYMIVDIEEEHLQ